MSARTCWDLLISYPTEDINDILRHKAAKIMGLKPPPRRPRRQLDDFTLRQFSQQSLLDAAMWYGAIHTGPCGDTIQKIFHIFYYAGVMYRSKDKWDDWSNNQFVNTACLLSHGQRVMVQIPTKKDGGDRLWQWLNTPDQIPPRDYATHGMSHRRTGSKELIKGHRLYFNEDVGWGTSLYGRMTGRHYGFNPALGGLNYRNPFSPTNDDKKLHHLPKTMTRWKTYIPYLPIKADGLNGHVYVYYRPPGKNELGGMLIGCENAQHGAGKNPHTKAGHGLGGRQEVSACGGKKWTKWGIGPAREHAGLICDLTDQPNFVNLLVSKNLFNPDRLDRPTKPVPFIIRR